MRYPSGGFQQVMSQILGETYRLESCFKSAQEEKLFPFILLDSLTGALQPGSHGLGWAGCSGTQRTRGAESLLGVS